MLIDGTVFRPPVTRYSPAGIPVSRFTVEHCSCQSEAGRDRQVNCRVPVVAVGEELAAAAARLSGQREVRVEGFLSRDGYRREDTLVLHAHRIGFTDTIE